MGSSKTEATLFVLIVIGPVFGAVRSEGEKWNAQPEWEAEPSGPRLSLRFLWKPAPCDAEFDRPYEFDVCDNKSRCSAFESENNENGNITLQHEGFDFFYWSKYEVRLRMECSSGEVFILEPFLIQTGPGELLPLDDLTVTPQDHSAVISWDLTELEKEQDAATHVLIDICKADNTSACSSPQKVPKSEKSFEIPDLMAGMSYTVEARMFATDEKDEYRSEPYAMNFSTEADRNRYPPVWNVSVAVTEFLNDATVNVSYLKPGAEGFWGVEIWFTVKDGISLERRKTRDMPCVIQGLPLFSDLTVHVKALYLENGELIGSEDVPLEFVILGGEIPKPVIKTLMAIDGSTILVQWEHPPKDKGEIHYTVSWGTAEDSVEVEENDDSFAIVRGFEPEKTYNFTVTIHVEFYDKILSNASDPKLLTMPPANALIPEVKIMSVTKLGISLGWNVVLPDDSKRCKFLVEVCPVNGDSKCFAYADLPHDTRMLLSEFQPFEKHNVTVSVGCRYFGSDPVTATSQTRTVLAAYPPGRVQNLRVTQEKYSRWINATWKSPEYNKSFPLKYTVHISGDIAQNISIPAKETTVRVKVAAKSWYHLLIQVRAVLDLPDVSFENAGPAAEKTLDFTGIPPPTAVKGPSITWDVYEFEVVPKDTVDGIGFTYQVAKETSDYSEEFSSEGLVPFRESKSYLPMKMKARVCNDDFCGADYYFNFTTNVGNPSDVQALQATVTEVTNIQVKWDAPKEFRGPLDGYQVTIIDKEEEHSATEEVKVCSYLFSSTKEHGFYEVQVEAFNEDLYGGERKFGRTVHMSVETSGTHPPPPRELEEIKFLSGTGFTWRIPDKDKFRVVRYLIQAIHMGDDISEDPKEEVTELVVTRRSLAYYELKPESYYIIKIASCSDSTDNSCGRFSENFHIHTGVGYPSAPEVQLVQKDATSIVIRWLEPEVPAGPISGYEVALIESAESVSVEDWTDYPPQKSYAEFGDLNEDTEYTIYLRAYNIDKNDIHLRSPRSTKTVSTESCGKVFFWEALFAGLGLAAISAVLYVTYIKYKRERPDELEIVMGEEPVAMEERVDVNSEKSVLP